MAPLFWSRCINSEEMGKLKLDNGVAEVDYEKIMRYGILVCYVSGAPVRTAQGNAESDG